MARPRVEWPLATSITQQNSQLQSSPDSCWEEEPALRSPGPGPECAGKARSSGPGTAQEVCRGRLGARGRGVGPACGQGLGSADLPGPSQPWGLSLICGGQCRARPDPPHRASPCTPGLGCSQERRDTGIRANVPFTGGPFPPPLRGGKSGSRRQRPDPPGSCRGGVSDLWGWGCSSGGRVLA